MGRWLGVDCGTRRGEGAQLIYLDNKGAGDGLRRPQLGRGRHASCCCCYPVFCVCVGDEMRLVVRNDDERWRKEGWLWKALFQLRHHFYRSRSTRTTLPLYRGT